MSVLDSDSDPNHDQPRSRRTRQQTLKSATLHAVAAAQKIGGDVHLLVAGKDCRAVAEAAAKIPGVAKVLLADDAAYANGLAENLRR